MQTTPPCLYGIGACVVASPFNDNDNDKRLGLTAQADQPDHKKKYNTPKIKMDNEALQKYTQVKSKRSCVYDERVKDREQSLADTT